MLKGHLDLIVLAALSAGPAHGYAVIEEIRRKSGHAFDLPEGTIYPALHRLEQAGLLVSRWVTAESGRRRRVYALTRYRTLAPKSLPPVSLTIARYWKQATSIVAISRGCRTGPAAHESS